MTIGFALALVSPGSSGVAGTMVVSPGTGLTASGLYGGPFSATSKVYAVSNAGLDMIEWSVVRNRPWVSLSQNGGTLAPGAAIELTVLINSRALDLPATNDVTTLTFFNQTTVETEIRLVTLNIGLAGPGTATVQSVAVSDRYRMTFTGEPGSTYVLEDASEVSGPWSPFTTNDFAGPTASYEFSVLGAPSRYFRSASSGPNAVAATLTLAQVQRLDNSIVQVTGDSNGVYVVEASTNTVDWIPVHTNKISAGGSFTFTNTVFTADASVQYRVVAAGVLALPLLRHVLIVGESLALGLDGAPALSVTPYGSNFRFRSDASGSFFSRLIETGLETIASGAANHVGSVAPLEKTMLSNIGRNGAIYDQQKKGTSLYALGLAQFRDAPQAAAFNLFRHTPGALFVVGGEGDERNVNFAANVRQWQVDYQKDIQFLTGFTGIIPMFHSQFSAWTSPFAGGFDTVSGPFALLTEAEANPTKTILVCPRYFLPYAQAGALFPGLHLNNEGYRWLGEYYGKAYKRVVVDGGTWRPLKPASIVRAGTTITALFDVPAPPLVLDTVLVTNPGNFGFEFDDGSGAPPAIVAVNITGPDTVEITLSAAPTGGSPRLRYAYRGISGNGGGPTTGPRGNLRDSDNTPSLHGNTLYNWCVHFDKPVN